MVFLREKQVGLLIAHHKRTKNNHTNKHTQKTSYFDGTRPAPSCTPLSNTGAKHACGAFATPSAEAIAACPGYNAWTQGVDVSAVTNSFYLDAFKADPTLAAQRTAAFKCKQVNYLLAALDVCNCNTPGFANGPLCLRWTNQTCLPSAGGQANCCDTYPMSTKNNNLPVTCADMLLGSNRLQRGLNFISYLKQTYPGFKPRFVVSQNTGLTSWDIYGTRFVFCFFVLFCRWLALNVASARRRRRRRCAPHTHPADPTTNVIKFNCLTHDTQRTQHTRHYSSLSSPTARSRTTRTRARRTPRSARRRAKVEHKQNKQ